MPAGEEGRDDLAELCARRALTEDAARAEAVERRHAAGGRTARENIADLVDPGSFVEYGRLRDRRPARPPRGRGPDLAHAGRRLARRHGAGQRRTLRRARRLRRPLLRLHGAGRHPGGARPPQEGPAVRADRADAAADRLLRRGRRRPARRHRLPGRLRARHPRLRALGEALRRGAADRRRRRPLLRRQRRDRRLLGPDRRHRERLAGDGRPGDDRGRRPGRGRSGRGRADRDAGRQRRRRRRRRRRGGRRRRRPSACSPTSRGRRRRGSSPTRRACARRSRSASAAPTTCVQSSRRSPTRARSPSCASASRRRWSTALARIEGRPLGFIANDSRHVAGAITSDASDKAARFLQLCDSFGLPVLSLVDTPGFMVGPEAEATGLVRHASRLLVAGAALRVPLVAVILRRGYGLGAQAMTGGSLHEPLLTVAWPSAHLGPMGLEGAVRLALRKELEAIADEARARAARPRPHRRRRGERPGAERRRAVRARRRDRPGRDPRR